AAPRLHPGWMGAGRDPCSAPSAGPASPPRSTLPVHERDLAHLDAIAIAERTALAVARQLYAVHHEWVRSRMVGDVPVAVGVPHPGVAPANRRHQELHVDRRLPGTAAERDLGRHARDPYEPGHVARPRRDVDSLA